MTQPRELADELERGSYFVVDDVIHGVPFSSRAIPTELFDRVIDYLRAVEGQSNDGTCPHNVMRRYYICAQCDDPTPDSTPTQAQVNAAQEAGSGSGKPANTAVPEHLPAAAPSASVADWKEVLGLIFRDLGELPDRDSPEDRPLAFIVDPDELQEILEQHIPLAAAPAGEVASIRYCHKSGHCKLESLGENRCCQDCDLADGIRPFPAQHERRGYAAIRASKGAV